MRRIKESEGLEMGSPADAEVNKGASASAWRLRRVLLAVLAVLLFAGCVKAQALRQFAVRSARIVGQSNTFNAVRLTVSQGARDSMRRATAYYDQQGPLVRKSAERFVVHPYFTHTKVPGSPDQVTWYDMVGARIEAMADLLATRHRDDFRVEKDRCEMYRFFARANLPHVPVRECWYLPEEMEARLRSGTAFSAVERWPAFLKACHLTQGSMRAVLKVPSAAYAASNARDILQWATRKWGVKADDWERPWRAAGNTLTDELTPGIMLQEGWHTAYNPYSQVDMAFELKVEVLWGRAYIAVTSDLHVGTAFLRDSTVEIYPTAWSQLMYSAESSLHPSLQWMKEPAYLDCVWSLAERAAAAIGCECVRIDIFLRKGVPAGCVVNEISLSSGMQYAMHFSFLARLWAEPLVKKSFPVRSNDAPVYSIPT